jgi:yeast amino acid transporter
MATLTEQSTEIVGLLQENPGRLSVGAQAGVNIFLIALTTFSHCLGVKVTITLLQCFVHSVTSV